MIFIIIYIFIVYIIINKQNINGRNELIIYNKLNAWVTLVMKGNSYIPGALALAQSLKSVNTTHKIVCMVTDDVTNYKELETIYDEVIHIKYIHINSEFKSASNSRYDTWINQSATKWRCLELIQYDKVMLVDSDVVFLKNFDYIFEFKCPAATFFNNFKHKYLCDNSNNITNNVILDNIKTNYGPLATMILLPTIKNTDFEHWITKYFKVHVESKSGYDEQAIGEYLIYKGYTWHCIDYKYNYMIRKNNLFNNKDDIPYIFHYYNKKPWISDDGNGIFSNVYWVYLYNVCKNNDRLKKYINKYNLPIAIKNICPVCKSKNKNFDHAMISRSGKILCNLYN
jgi:hypothetical protein